MRQPRLYDNENGSLVIPSVERDLAKASGVLYERFLTMFEMTETKKINGQSEARYIHIHRLLVAILMMEGKTRILAAMLLLLLLLLLCKEITNFAT